MKLKSIKSMEQAAEALQLTINYLQRQKQSDEMQAHIEILLHLQEVLFIFYRHLSETDEQINRNLRQWHKK